MKPVSARPGFSLKLPPFALRAGRDQEVGPEVQPQLGPEALEAVGGLVYRARGGVAETAGG